MYGIFLNEITILGFLAFLTFFLEHYHFFEVIQSEHIQGKFGPTDEWGWIKEFEVVHYSIFAAMCLFLASTAIFASQARQQVELLTEFYAVQDDPSALRLRPHLADLNTMSFIFTEYIKQHNKAIAEVVRFSDFLTIKFNKDVSRLIEFNSTTWVCMRMIVCA